MAKIAFTGSFDPPHEGHKYVVDFVKSMGLDIIVIVANNINKQYSQSLEERERCAREILKVNCYSCKDGNIGKFIKELGCNFIVRGLRDEKDYLYEEDIAEFNLEINGLKTFYIPSSKNLKEISSTKLRKENGNRQDTKG